MKAGEVVAGMYRLDARLGIGGMGEVWRATHVATAREFAVKLLHGSSSAGARRRFAREARISAQINHPNVIDVLDAGEHDEQTLFLAMELLDGISLADAFHLAPPLSVQDLLVILHDTARALSAAHAAGVVHRDIKPANIFLHRERNGGFASAKVLDFGVSKLGGLDETQQTKAGAVLGSPRYMSPEQARSAASVDHRADLWAMGVVLFEGLTGAWPYEGETFSNLVIAICTTPPASIDAFAPDLPESVRSIVRDCLLPLDRRLSSATALADRIALALQDPGLAERPLPRPLHPPTDSVRAMSGVRVRPLTITSETEADNLRSTTSDVRALRGSRPSAAPLDLSELLEGDDNAATRPIPPEMIARVFGRQAPVDPGPPPAPPAPAVPQSPRDETDLEEHLPTQPISQAMMDQVFRGAPAPWAAQAPPPAPAPAPVPVVPAPSPAARAMHPTMPLPFDPTPLLPMPAPRFGAPPVVAAAPAPPVDKVLPPSQAPASSSALEAPAPPAKSALGLRIAAVLLSLLLIVVVVALISAVRAGR
jgi:serine/threonine-protein kinase